MKFLFTFFQLVYTVHDAPNFWRARRSCYNQHNASALMITRAVSATHADRMNSSRLTVFVGFSAVLEDGHRSPPLITGTGVKHRVSVRCVSKRALVGLRHRHDHKPLAHVGRPWVGPFRCLINFRDQTVYARDSSPVIWQFVSARAPRRECVQNALRSLAERWTGLHINNRSMRYRSDFYSSINEA